MLYVWCVYFSDVEARVVDTDIVTHQVDLTEIRDYNMCGQNAKGTVVDINSICLQVSLVNGHMYSNISIQRWCLFRWIVARNNVMTCIHVYRSHIYMYIACMLRLNYL